MVQAGEFLLLFPFGANEAAATTVDIPEDWDPRAKQQPTGLIAYGAARRRPAGLWLPASASCLGRRSRLAGHSPNNDSLFLPQAAVVIVAIPRTGQIKCKPEHQQPR